MTIKFIYKCNKCNHDYTEQRGNDELTPFFTTCHSCKEGTYQETEQVLISLETERVSATEEIPVAEIIPVAETSITEEITPVEQPTE